MNPVTAWEVRYPGGSVAEGHQPLGAVAARLVIRHRVSRATVVLGSGQRNLPELADRAASAGLDVVRRRSGGGAVLLRPDGVLWVDVLIPRGDPFWSDDVGRSSAWLGGVWVDALSVLGVESDVHRGRYACGLAGRAICFVGRAAGEVLCGDRKVVGISQRRDRHGARFQCAVLFGADAAVHSVAPLVDLLGVEPRAEVMAEVVATVGGIPAGTGDPGPEGLFEAFLGALDRAG